MVFQIKEKIFSFGDNFNITDDYGNVQFVVEGQVFSLGNKLRLLDTTGNELFYIEQKLFKFLPEYTIFQGDRDVATVKKKLSLFGSKFIIDSDYGEFEIDGQPFDYDFELWKNGRNVADVSKRFFSFSDTYGVSISDEEEYAFILALVIVIDQSVHDDNR